MASLKKKSDSASCHKQKQEISDEIYLSIGTVKMHTYNIFSELNIKKRKQIFTAYSDFPYTQTKNSVISQQKFSLYQQKF
ncbi:LuxR C-terminal-related transcriptional regulator [Enterococcus sp. BWT-B8]